MFIKIVCDASFRLTIFGAWMYTINAGVFSTWITFGYYYIMVLLMIVLNIVFSWRDGDMLPCSLRNWLGKEVVPFFRGSRELSDSRVFQDLSSKIALITHLRGGYFIKFLDI